MAFINTLFLQCKVRVMTNGNSLIKVKDTFVRDRS